MHGVFAPSCLEGGLCLGEDSAASGLSCRVYCTVAVSDLLMLMLPIPGKFSLLQGMP